MDNSGLVNESEQLKRNEKNILQVIEELESQYNEVRLGNDFKKLGKLKKNIDEKRSKLAEIQAQIYKFENATENFVNEQKLESNLVFIEETNNKKLEELQNEHAQQLKEIEIELQKE